MQDVFKDLVEEIELFQKEINERCVSSDNSLDPYYIGLYNGVELSKAMFTGKDPKFWEVKEENK